MILKTAIFLFAIGIQVLSHAKQLQKIEMIDFLPKEKEVHEEPLPNGVMIYIQENENPSQSGSFRVVLKKPFNEEVMYSYDGALKSLEIIDRFFADCKEKALSSYIQDRLCPSYFHKEDPQELAVIAVGDFLYEDMRQLILKHFSQIPLSHKKVSNKYRLPIRVGSDSALSKVAICISYPNACQPIQTFHDLKQAWKIFLIQELYQQRQEHLFYHLDQTWIHSRPRFLYSVHGHLLASEEASENLLSLLLWQIETIRNYGFYEDEFFAVQHKLLDQLHYLSSIAARPDHAFLASYYADQFLLGSQSFCYKTLLKASIQFIEELRPFDLSPHVNSFLENRNQSIKIVYPSHGHSKNLTKEEIEKIIDRISSLALFYQNSENDEEDDEAADVWEIDNNFYNKPLKDSIIPIQLVSLNETIAKTTNTAPSSTELFHQLPIQDKEKRLIKTIITTMAEKNIIQLAFIKISMEKKGKKVHHVHPMRFIGYIFSNEELKSCMKIIKKSSFKWDAFVDGFSKRMKEEFSNNNLLPYVSGFAQQVGANESQINHYIQKKDWEGLIKFLL